MGGTRWIPHTLQALSTLIKGYSVFTTHLHQLSINGKGDAQAKAKGLLLVLRDPDILKFYHLLWDISLLLSRVSLKIQERNVTVVQVFTEIDFAKYILEKFKLTDGDKLSRVIQLMDGDRCEGQIMKKSLSRGANRDEIFHQARHDVMEKLLFCLNTRFQDSDTTVMKSTRIADLSVWPEEDALLGQYRDDDIKTITGHYLPILQYTGIDVDNMIVKWSSLNTDNCVLYNVIIVYDMCKVQIMF